MGILSEASHGPRFPAPTPAPESPAVLTSCLDRTGRLLFDPCLLAGAGGFPRILGAGFASIPVCVLARSDAGYGVRHARHRSAFYPLGRQGGARRRHAGGRYICFGTCPRLPAGSLPARPGIPHRQRLAGRGADQRDALRSFRLHAGVHGRHARPAAGAVGGRSPGPPIGAEVRRTSLPPGNLRAVGGGRHSFPLSGLPRRVDGLGRLAAGASRNRCVYGDN